MLGTTPLVAGIVMFPSLLFIFILFPSCPPLTFPNLPLPNLHPYPPFTFYILTIPLSSFLPYYPLTPTFFIILALALPLLFKITTLPLPLPFGLIPSYDPYPHL